MHMERARPVPTNADSNNVYQLVVTRTNLLATVKNSRAWWDAHRRALKVRHVTGMFFPFCQGSLCMKRECRASLEHVCGHGIKRNPPHL